MKFKTAPIARARRPSTELCLPVRRRTKFLALLPIRAQRVVLLAFLGIAQDFVGFVEFLEALLRVGLVLGDVGMVLQRQLAESAANLLRGRRARHTQNLIVVLECDSHIRSAARPRAIHAAGLQLTELS